MLNDENALDALPLPLPNPLESKEEGAGTGTVEFPEGAEGFPPSKPRIQASVGIFQYQGSFKYPSPIQSTCFAWFAKLWSLWMISGIFLHPMLALAGRPSRQTVLAKAGQRTQTQTMKKSTV
jgi:hypothetical protein